MHSMALSVGTNALVVKEFTIDENAVDSCQVKIVARRQGIIAFLLTLMGIDVLTIFEVYRNRVEYSCGSLSGRISSVMPLSSLSVATTGFTKPILLLVLGVLCFVFGALPAPFIAKSPGAAVVLFVFAVVISALFILFFYLHKSLVIAVTSHSGFVAGFAFKSAVIEGVTVNYEQAQRVIKIINANLVAQTAHS